MGILKAAAGDYAVAFDRYERAMRGFVDKNQQLGRDGIKQMIARRRPQLWLQLLLVRLMPYLPGKDLVVRKIKQQVQQAAHAVPIKEY